MAQLHIEFFFLIFSDMKYLLEIHIGIEKSTTSLLFNENFYVFLLLYRLFLANKLVVGFLKKMKFTYHVSQISSGSVHNIHINIL